MAHGRSRFTLALVASLFATVLASGCGSTAAPAPAAATPPPAPAAASPKPAATPAPIRVTLRLPFLIFGYDVPFVAAKEQGYYRKAGFDVQILEGKGSATTVETVANGSDTFGIADAGTAALLISKGAPVKVISVYLQTNPASFDYVPAHTHLATPTDLRGKTVLAAGAGDAVYHLLPAVLERYHMKLSDVHVTFANPANAIPLFARHPDYVYLSPLTSYPAVAHLVPGVVYKTFASFGVNPYSFGLLAADSLLRDHPGRVRRFVAATAQGWKYALAHQSRAVDMTLREFPKANRTIIAGSLAQTTKLLHTPNTQGHTIGWMAPEDWTATIDLLKRYGGLTGSLPAGGYYTNAFVPAQ